MKKIKKYIEDNKYTLIFVFLLFALSLFMSSLFQKESDYFWHISAGKYMFDNKLILTKDVFSWFLNGTYWMSHEWGFDILIYIFNILFGKAHLFVYSFSTVFMLLLILFFSNKKNYMKNLIFSLFWLIAFLMFCVYMQGRPHLLSFSFVALTIWFCYDLFYDDNSKKIYFLPLVALFWSNFHGGSSNLSYLFCFGFMIIGLFKFKFNKIVAKRLNNKQLMRYFIVSLLCLVTICINPHGIKMLFYPYANIFDSTMINFISEWQPTVLGNVTHYPYFVLIVVLMLILIFSKEKIRFIDLALFGFAVILGLKSIRFWGYTYLIMNYVIFNYIPNRKIDKGTDKMILVFGIFLIVLFIGGLNNVVKEYDKKFISNNMINVIKKENPKRLYNMYDYGGELIYNNISVFVDGRADLYSSVNLNDYNDISLLHNDYIKIMDKYNFDYYLVDKKYPINYFLSYSDKYEVVRDEKTMILYKKKDSTN